MPKRSTAGYRFLFSYVRLRCGSPQAARAAGGKTRCSSQAEAAPQRIKKEAPDGGGGIKTGLRRC